MNRCRKFLSEFLILLSASIFFLALDAYAQTEIRIAGPKSGFPVAVPKFCNANAGDETTSKIPDQIAKDLQLVGLFNVLSPEVFVASEGKCNEMDAVGYSDWSVIGAEGLVTGKVSRIAGGAIQAEIYLHDVLQKKAVIGKRYQTENEDVNKIAHRFANEVMRYFTGEKGVFGTKIAYVGKVGRFKELFIMDMDGSNIKQLTSDKGLVMGPAWSPNADRLVYTSYRTRRPELYTISPEGGNVRQITKIGSLTIGPEFSSDGTKILASTTEKGISNLVMFDLSGKRLQNITNSGSIDISPSPAPNGIQVAFCSNRGGGPQIYTMNLPDGPAQRISYTKSSYCTSPAWSPKGDKLAFVCLDQGNQIYLSAPDGSQAVQVTYGGNNEDPSWSPDGRLLAYSSTQGSGGGRNIMLYSIQTGQTKQLTHAQGEVSMPAWSPRIE